MKRLAIAAAILAHAQAAHAFCGFYVADSDQRLVNNATQVVLLRAGTRTVLAMQNDYQGPLADFAMVVPVPTVLHEGDVKTLSKQLFAKVDTMGSPRLVEYWEQDPCAGDLTLSREQAIDMARDEGVLGAISSGFDDTNVYVEDRFDVGEYAIEILSASDSAGLDRWLHAHGYRIPEGAEPLLRPYVEAGMKWFVARVDASKVHYENGHAALSPLRFSYDDDAFTLPVRLGLANSNGTQDLIVNIFADSQRYEVANYPNVQIPTNLDVRDTVKGHFGAFYAALFDRTLAHRRGAVVTEYAWQATTCDPCPGPQLDEVDLAALGADELHVAAYDLVLTRLHARYGKDLHDDLVFRAARPLVGGREPGEEDAGINNFQARYAIRHPWTGPVACLHPHYGQWGGPPAGQHDAPQAATNLAFADRSFDLDSAFVHQVPELALRSRDFALLAIGLGGAILLVRRPWRRRVRSKEST